MAIGRWRGWLALPLLAIGLVQAADPTPGLHLLTESNRPLSYLEQGRLTGLCTEIVDAVAHKVGGASSMTLLPWARAYAMALKEPDTGLFCTARTAEREPLFQWVGPLATVEGVFYARQGSGIVLRNLGEAKSAARILVVQDFFTHQFLRAQGFANLEPVPHPEDMLRMLVFGRAPLMFANSLTVPELLKQSGMAPSAIEPVLSALQVDEYLAFSRSTPAETVQRWQAALDELRRIGVIQRIWMKWGVITAGDGPSTSH